MRRLAALLLLCAALAGCGRSETEKVQATFTAYLNALTTGDGERACRLMTAREQEDQLPSNFGRKPGFESCALAVRRRVRTPKRVRVQFNWTNVNGGEASVNVRINGRERSTVWTLLRSPEGKWRVDGGYERAASSLPAR